MIAGELKQLLERPKNLEALREVLAGTDLSGLNGDARFAFVIYKLTRKKVTVYQSTAKKKK